MFTPARAMLVSLLLHVGGVAVAVACRVPSAAHAEWRGEEASVHWTVSISKKPSIFAPAAPVSEPPPVPPPPAEPVQELHEVAPQVPADVLGVAGPQANVEPPEERVEPEPAPPPPPAPTPVEEATPTAAQPTAPPTKQAEAPAPSAPVESKDSMKVEASPLPGHNPTPIYPFVAWRRHIEGTVVLSLRIDANGLVVAAHIARSSGNDMLDDAALTTLKTWRFTPACDASGPHECTIEQDVVFRIRA